MVLEAAFVPADAGPAGKRVVVLVDVLRATSTIALLLDRGCDVVLAADEAGVAAASGRDRDVLVCAEETSGAIAAGADVSPSLSALREAPVEGRTVVLRTTNGTLAARLVCGAETTCFAGSLLNGRAVMTTAVAAACEQDARLQVVCAGREQGRVYTLDDVYCAGFLLDAALQVHRQRGGDEPRLRDSARLALDVFRRAAGPYEGLAASESADVLRRIGCEEDIRIAAAPDTSRAVPLIAREAATGAIRVRNLARFPTAPAVQAGHRP